MKTLTSKLARFHRNDRAASLFWLLLLLAFVSVWMASDAHADDAEDVEQD